MYKAGAQDNWKTRSKMQKGIFNYCRAAVPKSALVLSDHNFNK